MTVGELREKLHAMTDSGFHAFRTKYGGDGMNRDWYVDHFVRNAGKVEAMYCELLGVPTEQERVNRATISGSESARESAEAARRSADAAVDSARHAGASVAISRKSL